MINVKDCTPQKEGVYLGHLSVVTDNRHQACSSFLSRMLLHTRCLCDSVHENTAYIALRAIVR